MKYSDLIGKVMWTYQRHGELCSVSGTETIWHDPEATEAEFRELFKELALINPYYDPSYDPPGTLRMDQWQKVGRRVDLVRNVATIRLEPIAFVSLGDSE